IEALIQLRHGGRIPATDDADIYVTPMARCLRRLQGERGRPHSSNAGLDRLKSWACASDVSADCPTDAVEMAVDEPWLEGADDLADQLRLSYEERQHLGLRTIGAFDVSKRKRARLQKAHKRQRDRERAARKRAENGQLPHAQSLSQTRPWE